jgi:hypothetical protein
MHVNMLYDQVYDSRQFSFEIVSPKSLHSQFALIKIILQVEKAEFVLWFHVNRSEFSVQRRFHRVFGEESPVKMSILKRYLRIVCTKWLHLCKRNPHQTKSLLKLRWTEFERFSFSVQADQLIMLPDS